MTRTIPKLTICTASGSDPDVIESMDDCRDVYGIDVDEFGDVIELCDHSPDGQCQYSWRDKWRACIHCKKESGL